MAGLQKAKKYDWKDSNLALFGSDTEKKVNYGAKLPCLQAAAVDYVYLVQDVSLRTRR